MKKFFSIFAFLQRSLLYVFCGALFFAVQSFSFAEEGKPSKEVCSGLKKKFQKNLNKINEANCFKDQVEANVASTAFNSIIKGSCLLKKAKVPQRLSTLTTNSAADSVAITDFNTAELNLNMAEFSGRNAVGLSSACTENFSEAETAWNQVVLNAHCKSAKEQITNYINSNSAKCIDTTINWDKATKALSHNKGAVGSLREGGGDNTDPPPTEPVVETDGAPETPKKKKLCFSFENKTSGLCTLGVTGLGLWGLYAGYKHLTKEDEEEEIPDDGIDRSLAGVSNATEGTGPSNAGATPLSDIAAAAGDNSGASNEEGDDEEEDEEDDSGASTQVADGALQSTEDVEDDASFSPESGADAADAEDGSVVVEKELQLCQDVGDAPTTNSDGIPACDQRSIRSETTIEVGGKNYAGSRSRSSGGQKRTEIEKIYETNPSSDIDKALADSNNSNEPEVSFGGSSRSRDTGSTELADTGSIEPPSIESVGDPVVNSNESSVASATRGSISVSTQANDIAASRSRSTASVNYEKAASAEKLSYTMKDHPLQ